MLQQTCIQQLITLICYAMQSFMQLMLQMTTQQVHETLKFQ